MTVPNAEYMREVTGHIHEQIRHAWENLEVAKRTLTEADALTTKYRTLLGCHPAPQKQARETSPGRD
jgi:hypothetical protein